MAGRCAESHLQVALLVLTLLTRETGRMTAGFRVESVTSGRERLEVARQILTEVPLIDGHNDLPWNIRKFVHNQLRDFKFNEDLRSVAPWSKSAWSHTDLLRLRRGMVGGQFWAAYVPCESQHLNAVQLTLEQIDLIKRLIDKYEEHLQFASSANEIIEAHEQNRIASLIGVEGGHSIGNSLAVLRILYDLGVRYMTLTHTCNTPWADSSSVEHRGKYPEHGGLTEFGKAVVREMNRLGMMVDLSHASVHTMKDALAASKAPVMFSHSSAFALCNSSRNVPDDVLKSLAWNGGLVMVTFYNYFVKCGPKATVADVAEHISYIRDLIGVDHIGVGGDFDGINRTPRGLEDVSMYPELFAELLRSGHWTVGDLKKVAGLNLLRVFAKVEKVRDDMRTAGVMPSEEMISKPDSGERSPCSYDISQAEWEMEL
ncbi:dipeptidase 1 [Cryptotermes secundus]|uniref:dipeptidase 1 n=1 Tax=Cryptotermes secundus TaxID=105785 RepID=UPI000CD7CBBF|nr:dipeptidase 1 [Cryptotermes secundus]XP_023703747.1 dipeptidase 1 [Cryptotermes secundus]